MRVRVRVRVRVRARARVRQSDLVALEVRVDHAAVLRLFLPR